MKSIKIITAVLLSGVSWNVLASENPAPAVEEKKQRSSNRMIVEEVIVSAQRREERLQDVPISISVFSEEQLEAAGIETAQDLQKITPGFTLTTNGSYNIAFMRGIGAD